MILKKLWWIYPILLIILVQFILFLMSASCNLSYSSNRPWYKIASAARNWTNFAPKQQQLYLPSLLSLSFGSARVYIWFGKLGHEKKNRMPNSNNISEQSSCCYCRFSKRPSRFSGSQFRYEKELSNKNACTSSELGTRKHCRGNVTMFSGPKSVGYCIIPVLVATTPFRHRDLNIFHFVSGHWSSVLRCCVVIDA